MTTIVVVRKGNQAAIAADSLTTFGSTRLAPSYDRNPHKIIRFADSFIGVAGSAAHQLVLENLLSKNPDLAVKLISFLCSKPETMELLKHQSFVSIRKDITPADMNYAPGSLQEKMYSFKDKYVYFVDNILTPGVVDEYYKLCPLVLVGKMTPMQFAQALDAKAAEMKK